MNVQIVAVSTAESSQLTTKQDPSPPCRLKWVPTSTDHIVDAEKHLLSLVKTGYKTEQVDIGSGPSGSKIKWFRSSSNEPRYINTVTFDSSQDSPTIVLIHGYGASQGFFFRNFDTLASKFQVIAIDLLGTEYKTEQVNIGSGPPGSKIRWFRSSSNEPRYINTVTFDSSEDSPTIVLIHGYGASQGFFFRNFHTLASKFRVIAIDLLGWGGSSRPDFTCKSTEETEAWFIDSFEEWRKAKNLTNFILLGHSFGGYVASKYALKHPEHVKHLILAGPAGFTNESEHSSEQFAKFKSSWKGAVANHFWESNFTPQKLIRGLGPWGRNIVQKYTGNRFGSYSQGDPLTEEESKLLTEYFYHTLAAKASGELCLKYIFSFGAFARKPLLESSSEWKVPTTFIYGYEDWMNYRGAELARKEMNVPCEIIRVPQAGHYVFIDNPSGFHEAVLYVCHKYIYPGSSEVPLFPHGLTAV